MLKAILTKIDELQHPRRLVFGIALAAAFVMTFVIWRNQSAVAQTDDPYGFFRFGQGIAEGRGLAQLEHPELPTTRRAPLYPGIIALLYVLGGPYTVVVRVLQCFLAAGTATLTFGIGRRMFSQRVGFFASMACAFHPMVLRYVPDIQVECLLQFFTTLMVWCGVCFFQKPTAGMGAALGAAGALGALTKGVLVICPPIFAVFWLLRRLKRRESLTIVPVAAIALAMCVVILPWTARNYHVTGKFMLISSNASGEFLRGFVFAQPKYFLLEKRAFEHGENEANQMQTELFAARGLVWSRDEMETERVHNEIYREQWRGDPVGMFKKTVVKTVIGTFAFWYVLTTKLNSLVVGALALGAWLLSLYGWVEARKRGLVLWPLLQPILSLNLLYAFMLALGRYSAPAIPTLMVLASWGLFCLLERLAGPKHGALAKAA